MLTARAHRPWFLAVILWSLPGCVFITGNSNPFSAVPEPLEEHVVSGEGRDKILLIDVSRVITGQEEEDALGVKRRDSTTARVREELDKAAKDDRVRAVVLRINSPGGTVTASDIVFHQVMDFKARRRVPVVAQMLDMATSGGYYVALSADEIVASPTTVTGSVGVVMYGLNLSGLLQKIGVKNQTLKAGEHKDIGSPLREMTPDEAAILQTVLAQMHQRFLTLVAEQRPGMSPEALRSIADGRILTAEQAVELHVVDRLGYLDDTVASAVRRAGLARARVVMYRRPEQFAENIYSRAAVPAQINLMNVDFGGLAYSAPQFMYLWLPGAE